MDGTTDDSQDYAPFGRPIFDGPEARSLSRVGVVDIGSNSIRLVVFDGAARSPAYFYNEKVMAGLGAGLAETGRLNPEGKVRALAALKRFALLAEAMEVSPMSVVATAAMREAEDGPEFAQAIAAETGLTPLVIDGADEAKLSAQGVLLGWPTAYGLVSDIGGSSMELAEISAGRVGRTLSSRLGPLRLQSLDGPKKIRRAIEKGIADLRTELGMQSDRLFLVGGSWRAIARIDMERRGYPLHVLHEYRMTRDDVLAAIDHLEKNDLQEIRKACGFSESRASLLPLASQVLKELVTVFEPHDIAVSSYGIREGLLYEQMPETVRERDPLIEACRFAEAKDARMPGFGRKLHKTLAPIFPDADAERYRIHRAACLLHDVSWRAHPDYRHEVCFDLATRANLGGLTHQERVFIGLALLHRYKNSRSGTRIDTLVPILSDAEVREAETLGRAMRFGAMFSGLSTDRMPLMGLTDGKLTLELQPGTSALYGEVAEARLKALAESLGAGGIEVAGR